MSLSVFHYCICAFLCCCGSFNPSLCPFVAISSVLHVCRLMEFYPNRAS